MGRKKTWKEQFDWVFDYRAQRSSKTKWIGGQEGADKGGVKGFFACYLLTSLSPRHKGHTYIGFTVNPRRRIRQHNGEIGSGAATTKKKRPWEMVMCIYGFPNNVSALQFEWAWQHPRESLVVSQAAASFKSLSGLSNKIKLAFTMLTLLKWRNLDLTVNFFSSKYTKHTAGCATLPEHVIVQICSMDELPCYTGIYNTHEDVCEDEDRDDLDDNDGRSIKDTSTTEGLANITFESDLYHESIDRTFRHSGIDDSLNWTKYIDGLDDNDLVDKTDIKDSSTTEGVANITTESDMYNYKSIEETISYSEVDDSYNWTEDTGLFHWGIEDYGSEDDLMGSEDLRNSIEDSGQLDDRRIEETISCIRIDDSLNRIEDVGVFDLGIEKNSREADLTRSDDLCNSIGDGGQLDSVKENMSELDHHPNEEMVAKRGVCSDELAANSPNICHDVEVIDLLSPSPGYKVGSKSKRRKVSRGVIDLTRSPIFVEA